MASSLVEQSLRGCPGLLPNRPSGLVARVTEASPDMAKSSCPLSREAFKQAAKPVEVVVNGVPMLAEVKEFSTGSFGWYLGGKTVLKVGDTPVSVQISMNLTVVGSKDASET